MVEFNEVGNLMTSHLFLHEIMFSVVPRAFGIYEYIKFPHLKRIKILFKSDKHYSDVTSKYDGVGENLKISRSLPVCN